MITPYLSLEGVRGCGWESIEKQHPHPPSPTHTPTPTHPHPHPHSHPHYRQDSRVVIMIMGADTHHSN
jgi:hypothetical protein